MALLYPYLVASSGILPFVFYFWTKKANSDFGSTQKLASRFLAFQILTLLAGLQYGTSQTCAILVAALFGLYWFKGARLNILRGIEISHKDRFIGTARTFFAFSCMYALYFLVVRILGDRFSILVAIPAALIAVVYFSPIMVRMMWNAKPILEDEYLSWIRHAFLSSGIPIQHFYFIDAPKLKFHNAMVCGPKWGIGPFSRSLFITRSLFESLSREEVEAVLFHEASHFKLGHIRKRMGASIVALLICMAFTVAVSAVWMNYFRTHPSYFFFLFANLGIQLPFVQFVSRKHEFEADLQAVQSGANPDALISALNRLTELSGVPKTFKLDKLSRFLSFAVHPTIAERSEAIRRGFILPKDRRIPFQQFAVLCLLLMAFELGFGQFNTEPHKRTVASIQPEP